MMTPSQYLEGAKFALGLFGAIVLAVGVVALAWIVWKKALFEAEKVVSETWQRIAEGYEERVKQLEKEVQRIPALERKVAELDETLDTYGCDNAPACDNRSPRRRVSFDAT